jgi:putative transposase
MVSKEHDLSQRRQCTLLQLSGSTLYYRPRGESAENLRFMEIIDKQFLETPWYGSRQMARHMERQGHKCGRRHAASVPLARRVRRLMRQMRVRRENSAPRCFLALLTPDGARVLVSGGHHGLV